MTILATGAAGFIRYHLAAQAGVRHSIDNPHAYTEANVTGFLHVLEGCRRSKIGRLIYASSSSVRGWFRVIDRPHEGYRLYNVGHGSPVGLPEFVHTVEKALGKRARKRFLPIPPGDVVATHAGRGLF